MLDPDDPCSRGGLPGRGFLGRRYEVELAGREYTAWYAIDGSVGAIEVLVRNNKGDQQRCIWKSGEAAGRVTLRVLAANPNPEWNGTEPKQ